MVYNIVLTYISFHFQFNTTKIKWVVAQKRLLLSKYTIWGRFFPREFLLLHYQTTKSIKSLKIISNLMITSIFQRNFCIIAIVHVKHYLTHKFVYSSSKDYVLCLLHVISGHPRETKGFVHG